MNSNSRQTNPLVAKKRSLDPLKEASSEKVMRTSAKTFWWASVFFSKKIRRDVANLYGFCRYVDDLADETSKEIGPEAALVALERVIADIRANSTQSLQVDWLIQYCEKYDVDRRYAIELIEGVMSDLKGPVQISNQVEFDRYCYLVAGTVGHLMCPVLGVNQVAEASEAAQALGQAMQVTNICRDVYEDLNRGRVYLPENHLNEVGLSSSGLLSQLSNSEREGLKKPKGLSEKLEGASVSQAEPQLSPESLAAIHRVTLETLKRGEQLYRQGEKGFCYIPFRQRIAIAVASSVYRAIGRRVKGLGPLGVKQRAFVPWWEKLFWTFVGIVKAIFPFRPSQQKRLERVAR